MTDPIVIDDGTRREPQMGDWPYWPTNSNWRNGREAGAYAAGLIAASPEKCGLVEVRKEHSDGAVISMVNAGLTVEAYSETESMRTFKARVAWLVWLPLEQ